MSLNLLPTLEGTSTLSQFGKTHGKDDWYVLRPTNQTSSTSTTCSIMLVGTSEHNYKQKYSLAGRRQCAFIILFPKSARQIWKAKSCFTSCSALPPSGHSVPRNGMGRKGIGKGKGEKRESDKSLFWWDIPNHYLAASTGLLSEQLAFIMKKNSSAEETHWFVITKPIHLLLYHGEWDNLGCRHLISFCSISRQYPLKQHKKAV